MKKIIIGSDHAGFLLKSQLIDFLKSIGLNVIDVGCFTENSVDYPDFAHSLASKVNNTEFDKGILICGSGNGVCMTANKYQNVRAALAWNKEIAMLARLHNDANIICLPARFISFELACENVETFLNTNFEGGRHQNRVNKISIKNV